MANIGGRKIRYPNARKQTQRTRGQDLTKCRIAEDAGRGRGSLPRRSGSGSRGGRSEVRCIGSDGVYCVQESTVVEGSPGARSVDGCGQQCRKEMGLSHGASIVSRAGCLQTGCAEAPR